METQSKRYKWFAVGCFTVGGILVVISAIGIAALSSPDFAQNLANISNSTANSVNFMQNHAIVFLTLSGSGIAGGLSFIATGGMSLSEAIRGCPKGGKKIINLSRTSGI